MSLYPHQSWTGELCAFFPRPQNVPLHISCAVPKATGRGLWLKAASPARLQLSAEDDTLELCLQDRMLAHATLVGGRAKVVLIPASTTSKSWLLLMMSTVPVGSSVCARLLLQPVASHSLHGDFDYFDE